MTDTSNKDAVLCQEHAVTATSAGMVKKREMNSDQITVTTP